ncbi:MAG: S49 family peptidase [Chromatiaceae bacterium]|nr:S49 family peptidase [Chromatiaceae bacterium]
MNLKFWKKGPPQGPGPGEAGWEQSLLERVVTDSLREQRRSRRWGILFKLLTFGYLFILLGVLWQDKLVDRLTPGEKHTAVIDIKGVIAAGTQAGAEDVIDALDKAYEDENTKGIILRINSPGGSPVQAGQINDEVRRLREKHPAIPVHAVVSDLCASGGYYVAVAAEAIHVDKASLIGSIGVRIDAFGFQQAIEELGIERRLLTAGANKGILDPFSPLPEAQKVFLQGQLDQLHQQFIGVVKAGRGDKLKGGEELFSGLFWNGEDSLELGLADQLGSTESVARDVIGAEKIVEFTAKKDLFERLADRMGTTMVNAFVELAGGAYPMAR